MEKKRQGKTGNQVKPLVQTPQEAPGATGGSGGSGPIPGTVTKAPPMFRRWDWWTALATTLAVMFGYYFTLGTNLTLEDAGELAVGSYYAGVPHPPGYPVWTLYTWLFTVLVPFSNIAWRVALSSAVAGALSCGLLALMVSRGSSLLLEGIEELRGIERRLENWVCAVAGFVAGCLLAFNGFMWSQAVIAEVYTLSVLSFMAVLCLLMRWIYAPEQRKYLYWAFFMFGICFTNHQTLIVAAMGIEVAILLADRRVGRDLFMGNSIIYLLGLAAKAANKLETFDENKALFVIYNVIGIGSLIAFGWATLTTRQKKGDWLILGRDLLLSGGVLYLLAMILIHARMFTPDTDSTGYLAFHLLGLACLGGCAWLVVSMNRLRWREVPAWAKAALSGFGIYVAVTALSLLFGPWFNRSVGSFLGYHFLGLAALVAALVWVIKKTDLTSEIRVLVLSGSAWLLASCFYFYMPIASMTNPPMNWGYPRTVEGFWHALTRGQYDKTNPTSEAGRLIEQGMMYFEGAAAEFGVVFLAIGIIPFLFLPRMKPRDQAWLVGLTATFLCLSFLLLILLNPSTDMLARDQVKVFFAASHIVIAVAIGYGIALLSGIIATRFEQYRIVAWIAGCIAVAWELYNVVDVFGESYFTLLRLAAVIGLGMAVAFVALTLYYRKRAPLIPFLIIFAIVPVRSVMNNWADNEKRGHLFGYWFGHDMFEPPFEVYPDMGRNAILFGGTDPGRFNPTYMIFCESFTPPSKKLDPDFDRSDVYLITQNALADTTYLDYIRAHYFRSAQQDPPFFSEFVRSEKERLVGRTNLIAQALLPLDRFFLDLGARIEADRRERGVYPEEEIYTPSVTDSQIAFQDYIEDATQRLRLNQLKAGEDVQMRDDRVQVSGQTAVMAINALLTRVIFDQNPHREFYVEESFPLEWMWPHLTPYGIIMKINRERVAEFGPEIFEKDHQFWSEYSERLIGNWITYDTPIQEICDFVERVYLRRDFDGFTGDRKFVRDETAQKAFSKLRSAIGGLYTWRLQNVPTEGTPERERLLREAEFALKQSFAFCPYSPEAVYKYAQLMVSLQRFDDALAVVETSLEFDEHNENLIGLIIQLERMRAQPQAGAMTSAPAVPPAQSEPLTNLGSAAAQVDLLVKSGKTNEALGLINRILMSPAADAAALLSVAQSAALLGDAQRLTITVNRLATQVPGLEQEYARRSEDVALGFRLVAIHMILQQNARAEALLDGLVAGTNASPSVLLSAAQGYAQLQRAEKLEQTLQKLVNNVPTHPEAHYDLAAVQAAMGKTNQALEMLKKAVSLSDARRQGDPTAQDLRIEVARDPRFQDLRSMPGFEGLLPGGQ